MARIRTIKPAFFSSLSNAELPKPTRLTWIGLWTYVDDSGRAVDDPRLVKAAIWPLDDDYTTKKVDSDLTLLAKVGKIERYKVGGRRYLRVIEWHHQRINRPVPSTLPASPHEVSTHDEPLPEPPPDDDPPHGSSSEEAVSPHGSSTEDAPWEGKGRERKGVGREGNVYSSSSNHHVGSRPAADDDELSPPKRALALIADRRIAAAEASGAVIKNPGGYRYRVLQRVDTEFGDQALNMLLDGMEPEAVADALVPEDGEEAKRYPVFEHDTGPVWEVDDDGNARKRVSA